MPGPVRVAVTKLSPCNFKDTVKNNQSLQNANYLIQAMQSVFHKQAIFNYSFIILYCVFLVPEKWALGFHCAETEKGNLGHLISGKN